MAFPQSHRKRQGSFTPGFKPIGNEGAGTSTWSSIVGRTTSGTEKMASQDKLSDKKTKMSKYGMKFQSAGTLVSIEKDTPLIKKTTPTPTPTVEPTQQDRDRTAFLEKKKASYTTKLWERAGEAAKREQAKPAAPEVEKAPPPLMSRQRELTMEKYAEREPGSDDEEPDFTVKAIIKKPQKLKFKIGK